MFKNLVSLLARLRRNAKTEGAEGTFPPVQGPLNQEEIRERLQRLIETEQLNQFSRLWAQNWLKAF